MKNKFRLFLLTITCSYPLTYSMQQAPTHRTGAATAQAHHAATSWLGLDEAASKRIADSLREPLDGSIQRMRAEAAEESEAIRTALVFNVIAIILILDTLRTIYYYT